MSRPPTFEFPMLILYREYRALKMSAADAYLNARAQFWYGTRCAGELPANQMERYQ